MCDAGGYLIITKSGGNDVKPASGEYIKLIIYVAAPLSLSLPSIRTLHSHCRRRPSTS